MNKPHILLYTDNPPVGGVPQYNHSMLCKLATSGYPVTAVQIQQSNPLVEQQAKLGVKQLWLDKERITGYAASYTDWDTPRKLLTSAQPDLIMFSDGWPLGNFAAKQVALEMGIPYVIVVGFVDENSAKVVRDDGVPYTEVVSYHYNGARAVAAVSQENLGLLHNLFQVSPSHSKVVHYGRPKKFFTPTDAATQQRLRQEIGIPPDAIMCFTSARMAVVKGFNFQLDAIEQLKQTSVWEKLYFVWAGGSTDGEDVTPQLVERVKELGVESRVKFLGKRWDIPDLLGTSDIYILTSKAEGMPLAIMEAMAKGLPVIASAVSGIPEELGDTGKLLPDPKIAPQATVAELVATLQAWVSNTELRQSQGKACQQRAQQMFTEERMLNDYLNIIEKVWHSINSTQENFHLIESITPEKVSLLESRVKYAYLVWKAWLSQKNGNLVEMEKSLRQSLEHTPFLSTETVINWIDSFTKFYQEKGEVWHVYHLFKQDEWQNLVYSYLR